MAPKSHACRSPYVNAPTNLAKEQDELTVVQGLVRWSNAESNKALTKAFTPPEALIPPLIRPSTKDLFIRFIKVFMETTQAEALAEPQERSLKARTPNIYSGKSHMDYYHICQQCEDYFETSSVTEMNHTLFAATFFCGTDILRWA